MTTNKALRYDSDFKPYVNTCRKTNLKCHHRNIDGLCSQWAPCQHQKKQLVIDTGITAQNIKQDQPKRLKQIRKAVEYVLSRLEGKSKEEAKNRMNLH